MEDHSKTPRPSRLKEALHIRASNEQAYPIPTLDLRLGPSRDASALAIYPPASTLYGARQGRLARHFRFLRDVFTTAKQKNRLTQRGTSSATLYLPYAHAYPPQVHRRATL